MLFNSYEFIFIFLPVTTVTYFLIAKKNIKASNAWLALASFFFYGWWDIRFVPILCLSILCNFFFSRLIYRANNKKFVLSVAIVINIALLFYFKYTDFFIKVLNHLVHTDIPLMNIILPLGISFWTFTQTAYLIDIYRGKSKPSSFVTYVLFVMIYPHLISGPIINHSQMIPQFMEPERHRVNYDNVIKGLIFFLLGLFKKVVIADTLAPVVSSVFLTAENVSILNAWIGVFAYTFQLYFDFSGYSEMAIGLGKILNVDFPVNFNSPYKSSSPIEFWQKWHITLGSWIRDYLYIPLGGNRHGQLRKMLNLFIAMTLSGFWHGAGPEFVLWGFWHGLLLVINHTWRYFSKLKNIKLPEIPSRIMTFICITVGWIFFRGGIKSGIAIIKNMFSVKSFILQEYQITNILILLILFVIVFASPNVIEIMDHKFKISKKWIIFAGVLSVICIIFLSRNSVFLYFDF